MVGTSEQEENLSFVLSSLNKDYSGLPSRIGTVNQKVKCECEGVTLHLHFPKFRQDQATVEDLVDSIVHYIMAFSLHRSEVKRVTALKSIISDDALLIEFSKLRTEAMSLFIKAQKATNRNGEAGELLLYLLTEWILGAPQLLAKMSLKTNRQMPVHGADGIHVKFHSDTSTLSFYWGESKVHGDVAGGITSAIESIKKSLEHETIKQELSLVSRYIDFSGLDSKAKNELLKYLDPFDPLSNKRSYVTTCLIGFDFNGFAISSKEQDPESTFKLLAEAQLKALAPSLAKKLKEAGLNDHTIEMFFFPFPSVAKLRALFQDQIGWK